MTRRPLTDSPQIRLAIVSTLIAGLAGAVLFFALLASHQTGKVNALNKNARAQASANAQRDKRIAQLTDTLKQHQVPVPPPAPPVSGPTTVIIEPAPQATSQPSPSPAPSPAASPTHTPSPPASPTPSPQPSVVCLLGHCPV